MTNGVSSIPAGGPTYDGFVAWVNAMMAIPTDYVPDDATLQAAYDEALNLTYYALACVPSQPDSPTIYALAVYNLGGAILLEIAQGAYWDDLRNRYGLGSMTWGIPTGAADQGTSTTLMVPWQLQGMTLMDLQLAKSPWGRRYLMFAGQWGAIWGLTI
jgi:hypothetical protein